MGKRSSHFLMGRVPRMMYEISMKVRTLDAGSQWAFYTILGMVGLWGGALLLLSFVPNPPLWALVDGGQLFLYSVGFVTSSLYLVLREWSTTHFPYRRWLLPGCILALTLSIVMFSGITLASADSELNAPAILVRIVGGFVLVFSLVLGYLVARAEEKKESFDFQAEIEKGPRRLEGEFDEGMSGQGES